MCGAFLRNFFAFAASASCWFFFFAVIGGVHQVPDNGPLRRRQTLQQFGGFGTLPNVLPGDLDSLEGTVLKEVFVHLGPDHCDAVADWLVETYGKPRFHADWDGITQTLSFQWFQAPGDDSRSCYLWWTHWPADKNSMAVYQGDAPKQPRPERIPDEQRAQFMPAWTAAVNRLLRGASPEKAASLSGLEGPLAERLRADLNDLLAHEQAPPTH